MGDQVFSAFLAEDSAPKEYIKSVRDRGFDGQTSKIYLTVFFTVIGFIMQFVGLRGLHASVILASLGATLVMSVLRTCLRTERMGPKENKLKEDRRMTAHKQQELDCFAFQLEEAASFVLTSSPSPGISSSESSLEQVVDSESSLAKHLIQTRIRLAELTSRSDEGSTLAWNDMPIRIVARNLAQSIEATMDLMSTWGVGFEKEFEFSLAVECQADSSTCLTPSRATYPIRLLRCGDAIRWRADPNELEAILGLWTWSLYKSEEGWRQPLSRLIGIDESEAGKEETYLYFHKWIFRQTEPRMVSLRMMDATRRLFGFESDRAAYGQDIMVMKTENDLETMAAQDIYIHFLRQAFHYLTELGGEVDVSVGLQGTYIAESSRINELTHCFESGNLGSREDALVCIVPTLKLHRLLPALSADCRSMRKCTDNFIRENAWSKAFQLVDWICQRSVGMEFECSVYELGYLCRRALLTSDKHAQEQGLSYICKIIGSDTRCDFLRAQRISLPSNWSQSLENQQWWQTFAKQLGWVAWHISINVPGMEWIQGRLGSQRDFDLLVGSSHHTEETLVGVRAMQEWLTLNHIDFERGYTGVEEKMGYSWALQGGFHALLYMFLVRLAELGPECPTIVQYAFTTAARCGSNWGIQVLQRRNADIDTLNDNGASALVEAVVIDDLEAAQTLLANGANPNGNHGALDKRPLILAAIQGSTEIVKLLLQFGADLHVVDSVGLSALYWAVSGNQLDTARFLLSRGADVNKGFDGSTPLQSAITSAITENQLEMLYLVLEHGADVNAAGDGGNLNPPLIRAAIASNADLVRFLLSKGADVHARDDGGLSALDWARMSVCEETAAILERAIGHVAQDIST